MKLDLKLMEKRVRELLDEHTHLYNIKSKVANDLKQLDVSVDRPGGMSLEECSLLHRQFYNSDFYQEYEDFDVSFGTPGLSRKCIFPIDFIFHKEKKFEVTTLEGVCLIGLVRKIDTENQSLEVEGKTKDAKPKDAIQNHHLRWSDVKKAQFHLEF